MPSLADTIDAVIGVDTHRDSHTAEMASSTGQVLGTLSIDNADAGFARLIEWATSMMPGPRLLAAVEGTRSYGIGVSRALSAAGIPVIEVEQPSRKKRRGKGKSDLIDAHHAVLTALACDPSRLATPRADGDREALRILLGARDELTGHKTAVSNQLKALLLTGDDTDRQLARRRVSEQLLTTLIRRRPPRNATRMQAVRQHELRRLAQTVLDTIRQLTINKRQLREIVTDMAPGLLEQSGIGPVSAAQSIVSYGQPGRVNNQAAFAALAGVSPLEASSGRTVRHRLNRGGDRKLNRAIHTIAVNRMRTDPTTRAYVTRRRAEGKTDREIRRCLKRYIARELYRTLDNT
ncbi:MAG: IS110 family transposase [Jatrophihabitantaceae bacterium]